MLRTVSFSASGQEQGIDQYIPPHLRNMFYKNPAAIHASHNGLDPYGFMTRGLVLYLPLWALKGSPFKSVDAYKHSCTVTGALWQPNGRLWDGSDDKILCGTQTIASASILMWIYHNNNTNTQWAMDNRDDAGAGAGYCYVAGTSTTVSVGAGTVYVDGVASTTTSTGAWHLYGVSGIALTAGGGAGNELKLGAKWVTVAREAIDGYIGEFWIYNRALSAGEITHNYNCTRWRYQ